MQPILLTHNILFLIGGVLNICLAVFVLFSCRKNVTTVVTTFALMSVSVAVFQISHLIGTNMPTAAASRSVLMWNLGDIFIAMFMTHWFLSVIGINRKRKFAITLVYLTGTALFVFLLLHPLLFLVDSVPKLYFPFYYEPGPLYFLNPLFFLLTAIYYFSELIIAYRAEKDPIQKNRFRYVLFSMIYAFIVGTSAFLLVFDIPFDPLWSSLFSFYTVPLAYAIVQYELLDIRIIAKQAFLYAVTMTGVGIAIGAINIVGNYVGQIYPDLPNWILPVLLSALISASGIYVWRRARQEDIAKYEFVNVVTHRFRTPLTEITWATDLLRSESANLSDSAQKALTAIEDGVGSMTELTNILVTLYTTDSKKTPYNFTSFALEDAVKKMAAEYQDRYLKKNVTLVIKDEPDTTVYGDRAKLMFAIESLISNALHYTPEGGSVTIWFEHRGNFLDMSVKDTGIGILYTDAALIFTKFYRADNARRSTVEGTGVGLYLAREIVTRNGGELTFFSEGIGKGTTFTMSLPVKV